MLKQYWKAKQKETGSTYHRNHTNYVREPGGHVSLASVCLCRHHPYAIRTRPVGTHLVSVEVPLEQQQHSYPCVLCASTFNVNFERSRQEHFALADVAKHSLHPAIRALTIAFRVVTTGPFRIIRHLARCWSLLSIFYCLAV